MSFGELSSSTCIGGGVLVGHDQAERFAQQQTRDRRPRQIFSKSLRSMTRPGTRPDDIDDLLRLCNNPAKDKGPSDKSASLALARAARRVFKVPPRTCAELRREQHRLTLGCTVLDEAIGGGFITGTVCEVFGEAGTGKTHLVFQLCLTVQLPLSQHGLDGGESPPSKGTLGYFLCRANSYPTDAIYLCTEPPFHPERMFSMLQANVGPISSLTTALEDNKDPPDPGSRVHVALLDALDTQLHVLRYQLPNLLATPRFSRVRVLIMDSVTANFRSEFAEKGSIAARSTELFDLGAALKSLASRFGICVVVTNQVTSDMRTSDHDFAFQRNELKPSLGLSWSNVVNTRLRLTKLKAFYGPSVVDSEDPISGPAVHRRIEVEFAPHLARGSGCSFEIHEGGLRGIPSS